MSDDEKLAKLLDDQFTQQGSVRNPFAPFAAGADLNHLSLDGIFNLIEVAEEVHAAGWRPPAQVITDPADLVTLPTGAIGVAGGYAAQHLAGSWWDVSGRSEPVRDYELIAMYGSVTVLYTPTETGDTDA